MALLDVCLDSEVGPVVGDSVEGEVCRVIPVAICEQSPEISSCLSVL